MPMIRAMRDLLVSSLATALLVTGAVNHRACAAERYVAADADTNVPNHYRTISEAMAALQPGDHLVIAAGLYREGIRFARRDWSGAGSTIIEGRGQVVIDSADVVTGWTAQGDGVFYRHWPQE